MLICYVIILTAQTTQAWIFSGFGGLADLLFAKMTYYQKYDLPALNCVNVHMHV